MASGFVLALSLSISMAAAQPGALPEKALEELITKAEALDMDEVRASMAQSSAQTPAQA